MTITQTSRDDDRVEVPTVVAQSAGPAGELVRLPTRTHSEQSVRRVRLPRGIERLVGVVLLFGFWELASRAGWLDPRFLGAPSAVVTTGWDMVRDGTLGSALWTSVQRVGWGLGLGIPVGALLAVIAGVTRVGDDLLDGNVQMLRFVPIIGLQPLLILWLGIGETTKITLIALGVAFPIYINTYTSIRSRDPGYDELATVVGLSRSERLRRIILPAALPGFIIGLRLAVATAWLLLVFAEQINASSGLGYVMIKAETLGLADQIVVCIVIYSVLGLLTDAIVRFIERKALRWQPGR
jgi:sulfonate transport system permease protein